MRLLRHSTDVFFKMVAQKYTPWARLVKTIKASHEHRELWDAYPWISTKKPLHSFAECCSPSRDWAGLYRSQKRRFAQAALIFFSLTPKTRSVPTVHSVLTSCGCCLSTTKAWLSYFGKLRQRIPCLQNLNLLVWLLCLPGGKSVRMTDKNRYRIYLACVHS